MEWHSGYQEIRLKGLDFANSVCNDRSTHHYSFTFSDNKFETTCDGVRMEAWSGTPGIKNLQSPARINFAGHQSRGSGTFYCHAKGVWADVALREVSRR